MIKINSLIYWKTALHMHNVANPKGTSYIMLLLTSFTNSVKLHLTGSNIHPPVKADQLWVSDDNLWSNKCSRSCGISLTRPSLTSVWEVHSAGWETRLSLDACHTELCDEKHCVEKNLGNLPNNNFCWPPKGKKLPLAKTLTFQKSHCLQNAVVIE